MRKWPKFGLVELWTVISCLGHIREMPDPLAWSEILTQAQIHLTAFVLDLQPLQRDLAGFAPQIGKGGSGDA